MNRNFFSQALREALATRHFNQAQLAEFLNVDPAYISRWLKGSSPRIDQMVSCLDKLGWDLHRAHPEYDALNDALRVLKARVEGNDPGGAERREDFGSVDDIGELLGDLAQKSRSLQDEPLEVKGTIGGKRAEATYSTVAGCDAYESAVSFAKAYDFADTSAFMMLVKGDHLAPKYPDGTLLVMRRILQPGEVPNGFEVLFDPVEKGAGQCLRQLVRVEDGRGGRIDRIIGAPVSPQQDYVFFRPREVRLTAAVVGAVIFPPRAG